MADSMLALTVWQPWAEMIAAGCKPFEFRGWAAPARLVGKRFGIHSGARPMQRQEINDLLNKLYTDDWRDTGLTDRAKALDILERVWQHFKPNGRNQALPLGHVVCTAILGQPIRNEELASALGIPWVSDSDREEHSNWGWPLTEIERVDPPAPATGMQGFWKWTPPP